jgi:curli production assembly/transport component CsgF
MKTTNFSQRSALSRAGLCLLGLGSCSLVHATELVYTPINPSFGGNPLNGTWLLNNAQAQNDYDDPDLKKRTSVAGTSALERFTNTGSLTTDAFIVNVVDDSGQLTIVVTDRATGEISEIQVSGLAP